MRERAIEAGMAASDKTAGLRGSLTFRFRGRTSPSIASRRARRCSTGCARKPGAKGTKEGCAEGDCGACTVVLSRAAATARLRYEPVNACILLLGQVDGAEVLTVEDLAEGQRLHPVQQAMVDHHGSQCGFCTPGIVMSLFALYQQREPATRAARLRRARRQSLPLHRLSADHRRGARRPARQAGRPFRRRRRRARARRWRRSPTTRDLFVGDDDALLRRAGERSRARRALCAAPRRRAGRRRDRRRPVDHQAAARPAQDHLARPRRRARRDRGGRDALRHRRDARRSQRAAPQLARTPSRPRRNRCAASARAQVRASGTVGGNIANGSPIGDLPPALIALGASGRTAQGRRVARPAAGGLLHRLRQAGSRRPANTCAASVAPQPAERTSTIAPSRCRSASTRTFPP